MSSFIKVTVDIISTWPRASNRSSICKPEKLSSLTSEVLRLHLQALSLPIDGSRQQLISRLKAALTCTSCPTRSTANRATKRVTPSDEDPTIVSENKSANEDSAMLLDDGASPLDDLMSKTTNAAPKSPALPRPTLHPAAHGRVVDQQALRNVRSQPNVPPAIQPALPSSRLAGTASPLNLHCSLDRSLEDKILRGEYGDFSLL